MNPNSLIQRLISDLSLKITAIVVFEKVNAPDRRSGKIRNLKATSVQVRD